MPDALCCKVRVCDGFETEGGWGRDPADQGERDGYVARQLAESDARVVPARRADLHAVEAGGPGEVDASGCGYDQTFGHAVF